MKSAIILLLLAWSAASCSLTGANSSTVSIGGNYVSIQNSAFSPAVLTVVENTRVYFTNNDSMAHTVTATSGQSYDSGNLAPGAGYSVLYTAIGTNAYFCSYHPGMTGKVIVTVASSASSSTASSMSMASSSSGASSSAAAAVPGNYVQITNASFSPAALIVPYNTTVYWTNTGTGSHKVSNTNGQAYASGTLTNGLGFSVTFTNLGTNWYKCSFHASMVGKVIVTN